MSEPLHLVAPRVDGVTGTVSWEERDPGLAARLRDGDANIGWLGDPRLSLRLNLAYADDPENKKPGLPRWEVWRNHESAPPTFVVSCVAQRVNGDQLLRMLAAGDSRTHDIAVEHLAARDRRDATKRAAAVEQYEDTADKLAWGLAKDLGTPMPDGRLVRLGGT